MRRVYRDCGDPVVLSCDIKFAFLRSPRRCSGRSVKALSILRRDSMHAGPDISQIKGRAYKLQ